MTNPSLIEAGSVQPDPTDTQEGGSHTGGRWRTLAKIPRGISRLLRSHSVLFQFCLIALLVRYCLAIYTAEEDVATFASASLSMAYGQAPYTYLLEYPPGWVFLLGFLGRTFASAFGVGAIMVSPPGLASLNQLPYAWYESNAYPSIGFDLYLKSLIIPFDILTGVLIYVLVVERTQSLRHGQIAAALWLFNPLVIFTSSIHGTFDVIPTFLTVVAYYFVSKREFLFGGLSLGLGTVIKVYPVVLLPFFLMLMYDSKRSQPRQVLRNCVIFLGGTVAALALVFWPAGVLSEWVSLFFTGTSRGGERFGGFNEWAVTGLPNWRAGSAEITAHAEIAILASVAVVAAGLLFGVWRVLRTRKSLESLRQAFWDGTFLFGVCLTYVLVPLVQPQYLVWVLPWLIVSGMAHRIRSVYVWGAFAVITGGAVSFYLFGLTSPLFFFQPMAFYTHLLSLSSLRASLAYWSAVSPVIAPYFQIVVALAILVAGALGVEISARPRGDP